MCLLEEVVLVGQLQNLDWILVNSRQCVRPFSKKRISVDEKSLWPVETGGRKMGEVKY